MYLKTYTPTSYFNQFCWNMIHAWLQIFSSVHLTSQFHHALDSGASGSAVTSYTAIFCDNDSSTSSE